MRFASSDLGRDLQLCWLTTPVRLMCAAKLNQYVNGRPISKTEKPGNQYEMGFAGTKWPNFGDSI